jgi:multidrug efflux pump subunit AcrB
MVLTHDEDRTDDLIRRLQRELDAEYPEARIVVLGIDQGPPVAAPLEIEIYGDNLDTLRRLGEEFRLRMERVTDITHSNTSLVAGAPKLVFDLDEQRVRMAGLDLADVADTLDAALRGRIAGEILEGTERLPVRARLREGDWATRSRSPAFACRCRADGDRRRCRASALSTLGSFSLQPANSPITRKNGERVNIVQGFVTRGVLAEEALKELRQILADDPVTLPTATATSSAAPPTRGPAWCTRSSRPWAWSSPPCSPRSC